MVPFRLAAELLNAFDTIRICLREIEKDDFGQRFTHYPERS